MKAENPSGADPALRSTLRTWQVTEPLPPRFRERVWARIGRQEAPAPASLWALFLERIGGALLRPSVAMGYLAVLLLSGLAAGYWHARMDNARTSEELGARYVQMLDPLLAGRR